MISRTARFVCILAVAAVVAGGVGLFAYLHKAPPSTSTGTGARAALVIDYPLNEALFPPDMAAPTFRWTDPSPKAVAWRITVAFSDGQAPLSFDSDQRRWCPPDDPWEVVKRRSLGGTATVAIAGRDSTGAEVSAGGVTIGTSTDEVGAPIFYREVNLPFREAAIDPSDIQWRFGPVSSIQRPPIVLKGLPTCANCHSFTPDGTTLAMEVDSANDKGSYVIAPVAEEMVFDKPKIITWNDYRREDDEPTFGLLAQIAPDGQHVLCMVKDRSVFTATPGLAFSQLFFPIRGILVYYRRATGTFHALPGADDRRLVQANPTWSPDGRTILFARAEAYHLKKVRDRKAILLGAEDAEEFLKEGKPFKYDIYRMPWNDGKGGTPEPLPGASGNGKSNYFPRYSPDGKWIVFCQAENYMLLQPDSALYIMPAEGGQPRRMRCNTPCMNSWHSWSPNGRWLVFSSKTNGPYTQLWLTHVDEQGRDTPAVALEQFTAPDRAANIPEFVNCSPNAIRNIRQEFLNDVSFVRAAVQLANGGDQEGATRAFQTALKINPNNPDANYNLGLYHSARGRYDEALALFAKAVEVRPDFGDAQNNLGGILLLKGQHAEAREHLAQAIRLQPDNLSAHNNMGASWAMQQNAEKAALHYRNALAIDPDYAPAHKGLGEVLLAAGDLRQGVAHLEKAAAKGDPEAHASLGMVLTRQGLYERAAGHLEKAVAANPKDLRSTANLALLLATCPNEKVRNGARAVELAQRACQATRGTDPLLLDALAAACAEAGNFPEAVRAAEAALRLAKAAGMDAAAATIAQRLEIYRQNKPLRLGKP